MVSEKNLINLNPILNYGRGPKSKSKLHKPLGRPKKFGGYLWTYM